MKNYFIFLKKELFEAVKTYKLLIMGVVFLLFGMASPLMAKFTPEIIKWAMESDPAMAGMDFSGLITQPSALDSWFQFYGNAGQMGFFVLVIIFSSMLSSELSIGTLTIMLSKGLSRSAVILSKLTSAVLIWTASFGLSVLTAWGYTNYIFDNGVVNLFFAMFCLWLFGMFLLAVTALMATLVNKGYACMFSVGAVVIVLSLIDLIPKAKKYNPISLSTSSRMLLAREASLQNAVEAIPKEFIPAIITTVILILVFTVLAVISFNKRKR